MKTRKIFLVGFVIVALAFIHLAIYANNVSLKYGVDKLKKEFIGLYSQHQYLASTLSAREALPGIKEIAMGKLAMVYPDKVNYIIISGEAQ